MFFEFLIISVISVIDAANIVSNCWLKYVKIRKVRSSSPETNTLFRNMCPEECNEQFDESKT